MTQIVEMAPRTGFEMPDADQLARLLEIVTAEHRQFRGAFSENEFRRAFWLAGRSSGARRRSAMFIGRIGSILATSVLSAPGLGRSVALPFWPLVWLMPTS